MFRSLQLLCGASVLLAACASPQSKDISGAIAVNSAPPGATASVSSGEWCVTPCALQQPVAGAFTVRLQKDGFEPQEIRVEPEYSMRATGQLRQARRDPELRRKTKPAQTATYAPVTAQLQPLADNPDAQIAALVYAQKVDPVLPSAVGSSDLNKRAAVGQQFGVRVAGYDQAPVEFAPVSRKPDEGDGDLTRKAEIAPVATSEPTNITASSFGREPYRPVAAPVAAEEATGALTGDLMPSTVVDIPLEDTAAPRVRETEPLQPTLQAENMDRTEQKVERQVAILTPTPKNSTALPALEVAPDLGNAVVQLASFRDEAAADQAVTKFMVLHSDVLGSLIPDVQRADLGEKGIYYRVRFAGLATIEEARSICNGLSSSGQGCMATRR